MDSMSRYMDGQDVAQTIRMTRAGHKGTFLIVEGTTDVDRFKKFIDLETCHLVPAATKSNALDALDLLNRTKFRGVLAIVDADFDRVTGRSLPADNLIYSEFHDLDLDWLISPALGIYLDQVADEAELSRVGGPEGLAKTIVEQLRPVSATRLLNIRRTFRFKVAGINVSDFFQLSGDLTDAYVSALLTGGRIGPAEVARVKQQIREEMRKSHDNYQLVNGHDFCQALGAALRGPLGKNRKHAQTLGSEIELHIRLAFESRHFRTRAVFAGIADWERRNGAFRVVAMDGREAQH